MIVNNFDIARAIRAPHKADAPLLIDANAVLAFAVPRQSLEMVAWGRLQKLQSRGSCQLCQFPFSHIFDVSEPSGLSSFKQGPGVYAPES